MQSVEDIVAKEFKSVAVELIGARGRRYGKLRASRCSGFGGRKHGVNAKFVNGVEGNRQAHVRLLRLVDDIGGVNAIVSEIVVVAPPARKSNRTLVTTSGIDGAGLKRGEIGPVSAIERQFFSLHLADAGAKRIRSLVHLLRAGRDVHPLLAAGDLQRCVKSAGSSQHLLDADKRERLEAFMVKRDGVRSDRHLGNVIGSTRGGHGFAPKSVWHCGLQ